MTSCSARASVDLPLPDRPVKNSTRPCSSGRGQVALDDRRDVVGEVALAGHAQDLAGGVVLDDPLAEPVVGLGVPAAGQRYGDHVGVVEVPGGRERRPDQRGGGELGGAGPGEGEQQDRLAVGLGADPAEVGVGEGAGHRHGDGGVAVLLLDLGGGEVEPAEGAELVVRQRGDRALDAGQVAGVVRALDGDPGERDALGVDQLDLAGLLGVRCRRGRHLKRDHAVRALEAGQRRQGSVRQQLEVVELARGRAVLGRGSVGHGGQFAVRACALPSAGGGARGARAGQLVERVAHGRPHVAVLERTTPSTAATAAG